MLPCQDKPASRSDIDSTFFLELICTWNWSIVGINVDRTSEDKINPCILVCSSVFSTETSD